MKPTIPTLLGITTGLFLQGCAQQSVTDTTPRQPTNVLTAEYVISGYIMPDSRGKQTVYTRADRRRIEQSIEYDSLMSRRLLGNNDVHKIARVDKGLSWNLDVEQERYEECPLAGCTSPFLTQITDDTETEQEEKEYYDPSGGEECDLQAKTVAFEVTPKWEKREINGFPAERYLAEWRLVSEDEQGRQDTNRLSMDFWMTDPTVDMRAGWEINGAFHKNYAQTVGATDNPLSRFVGSEIYKAIAMFSGDIGPSESDSQAGKLNALQGFPVSIKMEWYSKSEACPEARQEQQGHAAGFDYSDPAGALTNMATGFLKNAAERRVSSAFKPDPNKPLFTYIYDVTSSQIQEQRDSLFQVPAGYKLQDRR